MGQHRALQLALGLEGLSLLRRWLVGDPREVDQHLATIAHLSQGIGSHELDRAVDIPAMDTGTGYSVWSATYDTIPNPVITMEERAVWPLLREIPTGAAIDAATGTGRHAELLKSLGHAVVGLDASPAMLSRAREKVREARFVLGTLEALPFPTGRFDLGVCALALTHCRDLKQPLAELARVVRPGGRIVVSDVHPMMAMLGGHALFPTAEGGRAFIPNCVHHHSDYLSTFQQIGLSVRGCIEPRFTEAEIALVAMRRGIAPGASFPSALHDLPGVLVWDLIRD